MRRKDREITDRQEMLDIMGRCDVCRLALNGSDGYPYLLPLNFGMREADGVLYLYFHGAAEGTKYDLIARDCRASFEMDCSHRVVAGPDACDWTMEYESVIGRGRLERLSPAQAPEALPALMEHYGGSGLPFSETWVAHTAILRLRVEQMTAKAQRPRKG